MTKHTIIVSILIVFLAGCSEPKAIAALPAKDTLALNDGVRRLDLRFPCGDDMCAGWLYVPATTEPAPTVVMGHGFAGTRDVGLAFFAEHFAQAGIAAFVFDYRHFGASGGAPRQLVDPWKQLEDWKAAIAFVRRRGDVDGTRLAVWGASLGGGLALVAAARDNDIAAVVAQAPQVDATADGEATFPGYWWVVRLLLAGWSDLAGSLFDDQPLMIAAIAPSDGFGMIVDDAAFVAFRSLVGKGSLYRNEVAARSIFTFDDYNPAIMAASLKTPTLLIASPADRFAPFRAVEAFAEKHVEARVERVEGDHFDIYAPPQAERAANLARMFLSEHLRPASPPSASK